jgi:hypothetical protein
MDKRRREFDWDAFMSGEAMRTRVLLMSMFIAVYEHLKESMVSQACSLYTLGDNISNYYSKEVLCHDKKPDYSTLIWMKQNGALGDDEIKLYKKLTKLRNESVHEYVRVLTDKQFPRTEILDGLRNAIALLKMIDHWFFIQSPEFAIMQAEGNAEGMTEVLSSSVIALTKLLETMFEE